MFRFSCLNFSTSSRLRLCSWFGWRQSVGPESWHKRAKGYITLGGLTPPILWHLIWFEGISVSGSTCNGRKSLISKAVPQFLWEQEQRCYINGCHILPYIQQISKCNNVIVLCNNKYENRYRTCSSNTLWYPNVKNLDRWKFFSCEFWHVWTLMMHESQVVILVNH